MKLYYPMERLADLNIINLPLSEENLFKLITQSKKYSKEEIESGELGFGVCEVVEVEVEIKSVAVCEIKPRVEFVATRRQIL